MRRLWESAADGLRVLRENRRQAVSLLVIALLALVPAALGILVMALGSR